MKMRNRNDIIVILAHAHMRRLFPVCLATFFVQLAPSIMNVAFVLEKAPRNEARESADAHL